ncbi:hypothetical protein AOL_s00007g331 [Orbilia oligospora ATCC 24927]|uniref:BTB domain-containing protein n=1 Tax=Arthrobotrys oligospora (strain ATCC 24927 / CBS 115.81 / DSM 1491) TaxID=756982 RepID=G1X222_ARTOA|nr:hypothetical protein AOL_s00007g331 [Orbilia oligospora ATCC 24927]EGX52995.1 hypothetical protein AOL_s00007g331 [Orbilia oligospora ATCC 24927]
MAVHSFSSLADLVVELTDGSDEHLFLVSSEILRVVSPVWRKALDPESKFAPLEKITVDGTEYRKTTLDEIDSTSLTHVFNILHHRAGPTPRSITFKSLRDIAVLADQYDFADALAPWPQFWIEDLAKDSAKQLEPGYEDWLLIATIFATVPVCETIILNISKQLICDLVISPPGNLDEKVNLKHERWSMAKQAGVETNLQLVPEKILEFIREEQEKLLTTALLPLWIFAKNMTDFSFPGPKLDESARCRNPECSSLALGSLLKSINSLKLQNILMTEEFKIPEGYSPESLIREIESIRMTTLTLERDFTYRESQYTLSVFCVTHNASFASISSRFPTLAQKIPEDFFLGNQYDSVTKHTSGRFATCPVARHLASQQTNAVALLQRVKGYSAAISS